MEDRIYEIIASWAAVPTWYTSHPLDQDRFSKAMASLVDELGQNIDINEFERALRRHAEVNPEVLGNPEHWDKVITKYVLKAETILTYEQSR